MNGIATHEDFISKLLRLGHRKKLPRIHVFRENKRRTILCRCGLREHTTNRTIYYVWTLTEQNNHLVPVTYNITATILALAFAAERAVAIRAVLAASNVCQRVFTKLVNGETITKKDKSPVTSRCSNAHRKKAFQI